MIYLLKLSEIEKNFEQLFCFIGHNKKEQIAKCTAHTAQVSHLASALLYRYALGNNYEELIKTNEHGKPYTENGPFFNVSHAGEYAALYIGDNECGIDIEKISENRIAVYSKVFSNAEIDCINQDKTNNFFTCWTKKESISKAIGRGFTYPLKSIDTLKNDFLYDEKVFYTSTINYDNHIISVTEEKKSPDMQIKILAMDDLIRR